MVGTAGGEEDESKHPPHIHTLDVVCSKTMMTINIEFNRAFDGVIYSKVKRNSQLQTTIASSQGLLISLTCICAGILYESRV